MAAHDRGLDEASTFALRVCRQREHDMAGVEMWSRGFRLDRLSSRDRALACNHASHEPAELLLVHATRSTVSMMPTTAASTGASVRPNTWPAARPSITIRYFFVDAGPK